MDPNDPLIVVQRMFSAFSAGNLDALVDTVHPESRWHYLGANPGLSNAQFSGKASVRSFFERILKRLDMTVFSPDHYVVQGHAVAVFGHEEGSIRKTGQTFRNEWVQKYVVVDGLITEMTEYNIQVDPKQVL